MVDYATCISHLFLFTAKSVDAFSPNFGELASKFYVPFRGRSLAVFLGSRFAWALSKMCRYRKGDERWMGFYGSFVQGAYAAAVACTRCREAVKLSADALWWETDLSHPSFKEKSTFPSPRHSHIYIFLWQWTVVLKGICFLSFYLSSNLKLSVSLKYLLSENNAALKWI